MLCEPILRVIEGEDGALLLAPVRRPCCLELLCYQESLFSRVVWGPDRTPCGGHLTRFHDDRVRSDFGEAGLFLVKRPVWVSSPVARETAVEGLKSYRKLP
jgi:hypothetical protein